MCLASRSIRTILENTDTTTSLVLHKNLTSSKPLDFQLPYCILGCLFQHEKKAGSGAESKVEDGTVCKIDVISLAG